MATKNPLPSGAMGAVPEAVKGPRKTAVVYVRKRAATVVLYVGRHRISARIKAKEALRIIKAAGAKAARQLKRATMYVVRGAYASLFALAIMRVSERHAWKVMDISDYIDRDIAKFYGRIFTLKSEGAPEEVIRLWKEKGLGAEVPPEVAAKTHPRLLRNFWGTYKLEEYPWIDYAYGRVEVVWL